MTPTVPGRLSLIGDPCHHVAPPTHPGTCNRLPGRTAGASGRDGVVRRVSLPTGNHDASFAASEPPTHDSWKPDLLPDKASRRIVNVGLREIKKVLKGRWSLEVPETAGRVTEPPG